MSRRQFIGAAAVGAMTLVTGRPLAVAQSGASPREQEAVQTLPGDAMSARAIRRLGVQAARWSLANQMGI